MNIPVVAIVGRPNVGKSTLFNRIIKKREAIVDDQPGVTRDRLYAETEWQGQSFMVVDTGGYLPHASDELEKAIREQVDIAIEEADVILYVVDRATGITDWDNEIAEKLKKSQKNVVLVVNKIDNELMKSDSYEFYNLGLGEPISISALHGREIGDMLDQLITQLQAFPEPLKDDDAIKLAIIGKENVGKSSFVNTLIGKSRSIVTSIPGTTRDPIDSELQYKNQKYLLIDTAGLKRKTKVRENILFYSHLRTIRSIQRSDVVIYFLDATDGPTRQDMRIIQIATRQKKGIVLAVNKWDLIPKETQTMSIWQKALKEKLGSYSYIPIVFTSVLEKQRLYKLMDITTEIFFERQKHISTHELNDKLLPLIKEISPPSLRGKEIKINFITQVQNTPPVIAFFSNFPKLIKEGYRRFLENKIREFWSFKGVPLTLVFKTKYKKAK